jgi:DNA-binding XRE family transcriptional regulator
VWYGWWTIGGRLKKIGELSNGNYILEATPLEWIEYVGGIEPSFRVEIGEEIKSYRKRTRTTQKMFAKMVGVSRNYISLIERGHKNISVNIYKRIYEVINEAN